MFSKLAQSSTKAMF
ncbi:hypothetical protein [Escherichia coli]